MKSGDITKSGNFVLKHEIKSLDEFWKIINTEKSIYARHKVYPSAFFHNWSIRLIKIWIDRNWFYTVEKIK